MKESTIMVSLVSIAAIAFTIGWLIDDRAPDVRPTVVDKAHALIASAGEWVTNPDDGTKICRLRSPITWAMTFTRDLCEDWQVPMPAYAQTVAWFRVTPRGYMQINIEGQWRP